MREISSVIGYQDKIQDLDIGKIEPNQYNPRGRWSEAEEDELIDSILTKGILNPIVVYKKDAENSYVILDGERRYRACKKINIKNIPARILVREPDILESLSLMFHIHNVREEWTEFAISLTIKRIIDELGKTIQHLNRQDVLELTRITSLSEYKINKYLKYLDYPDEVFQMFHLNEINQKRNEGPDPDILLEMHKPIADMKDIMPEIVNRHSIKDMIVACIEKKEQHVVNSNKDFRLLSQALTAAKNYEIDRSILKQNLVRFFSDVSYPPSRVYHETAEVLFQYKHIKKNSESFLKELRSFDFDRLDYDKRLEVYEILQQILAVISDTL